MFGKVFASIYDGTLADHWQALVTFQQLIVLCTADGVVDMTPNAISRKTGIPIDIIKEGLAVLERPDVSSRSPDADGRRIMRLDEHRNWGWFIVNHEKYRQLADANERRAKDAERKRVAREKLKKVKNPNETPRNGQARTTADNCGQVRTRPDSSAMSAHTDTDTDTDTDTKHSHTPYAREPCEFEEEWQRWLSYRETVDGRKWDPIRADAVLMELERAGPEKARRDIAFSIQKGAKSILDSDNDFSQRKRQSTSQSDKISGMKI